MADLLHPVGDGFAIGSVAVVGSADGVSRFTVLTLPSGDGAYVSVNGCQGVGFDTVMQARGPISFGEGVMRGRFARLSGDGGVELSASLWRSNPAKVSDATSLISYTKNFTVWHNDFQEYSIQLIGREVDDVARYMGNLWIRVVVVSAPGGKQVPTLGVSALWVEVPKANDRSFTHPRTTAPPNNALVSARTFSGRAATARYLKGEWYGEDGSQFEIDKHSLPLGADGNIQAPRSVNGWNHLINGSVTYGPLVQDTVTVLDAITVG